MVRDELEKHVFGPFGGRRNQLILKESPKTHLMVEGSLEVSFWMQNLCEWELRKADKPPKVHRQMGKAAKGFVEVNVRAALTLYGCVGDWVWMSCVEKRERK